MVSYSQAFQEGLAAAEKMERDNKEIEEVFAHLNREINIDSGGKLQFIIEERVRERLSSFLILARNPKVSDTPTLILARWKQDRAGYPCKISWGDREYICADREALENTLAELLRDPIVGRMLDTLMKLDEEHSSIQEDLEKME